MAQPPAPAPSPPCTSDACRRPFFAPDPACKSIAFHPRDLANPAPPYLSRSRRAPALTLHIRRPAWYAPPRMLLPRPGATTPLQPRRATSASPRLSSIKPPERCPHCNSKRLIKKGTRKKKLESVPLYRCRSCGRTFAPGPRAIRNKTYPVGEILDAIALYGQGYSLAETSKRISSRYGHSVNPSTVSRWLNQHPRATTYARLRARGKQLFTPTTAIRSIKLYHRQVYEFAYHRAKLAFLRDGTLDDKRAASANSTSRFSPLADFLEAIPRTCPHDLFNREDGARSSQLASDFLTLDKLVVVKKQNAATDTAALILPAVGSNYERHPRSEEHTS